MKQIIILAVILMAGTVLAGDPNSMPNPQKGEATWCIDEVHKTLTIRVDMSSVDRWFLCKSQIFRDDFTKWVSRIPRLIEDLKKLGAIKWMHRQTLEETESEKTK